MGGDLDLGIQKETVKKGGRRRGTHHAGRKKPSRIREGSDGEL